MSEAPFNFLRDLQNLGRPTEEQLEAAQRREAERRQREREAQQVQAELDGYWAKLDMRKMLAAQHAIRQIPQDTVDFLRQNHVPYNIDRRFDRGERRLGLRVLERMRFWGYEEHEYATGSTYLKRDGLTQEYQYRTGNIKGAGISRTGQEYDFNGKPKTPYLEGRGKPMALAGVFVRADLRAIQPDLQRTILVAASALDGKGLDRYLAEQYDRAKWGYQRIVESALKAAR